MANSSTKQYNKKQQRVEVRWLQSEAELYLKQWQRKYHQLEGITGDVDLDCNYHFNPSPRLLLNNHLELYDDWYRTSKRILDMDLDSMDCDRTSYQYNTNYATTSASCSSRPQNLDYLWRREQQKILLNCADEDDEEVTQSATSETTENIDDDEEVENICCGISGGNGGQVKQRFDLNNSRNAKTLNSINDSFNIYRVIIDNNKLPKQESVMTGEKYASLLLNMATNSTIKHESPIVTDNHKKQQQQQTTITPMESCSQPSTPLSSSSKKSSTTRNTSSSKSSRCSSSASSPQLQTPSQPRQQRPRPRPPPLRRQIFKCEHPGCTYQSDRNFNFLRHKRTHRKNRVNDDSNSIISTSIISNTSDSNATSDLSVTKQSDLNLSDNTNNNSNNTSNYSKSNNNGNNNNSSLLTVRNTSDTEDCDRLFILPISSGSSISNSISKHS